MKIQVLNKANELQDLIKKTENEIKELSKYTKYGKKVYMGNGHDAVRFRYPVEIRLEPRDIQSIIQNKKQRISALKAELERL